VPADILARLAAFGTPSIANALEILGEAPTTGFTDPSVGLLTGSKPFVGRALTATMRTASPKNPSEPMVATETYWRYIAEHEGPAIVVVQDLDDRPIGAMYGEVQGRLHRALGVVGVVTNGAVRDVRELSAIDYPIIGGQVCVSHAYGRFLSIDRPVIVAGLEVGPGDLLHADRHGVQRIPRHIDLEALAAVAGQIEALESELFAAADTATSIESFLNTWATVQGRWPATQVHSGGPV
jgi:4-hydroxy-4-methyl-2-oxoglutarate aldolase